MFGVSFVKQEKATVVEAAVGTYYDSIGKYDTGDNLLSKLRTLNANKRTRLISYNDLWDYFSQTDPYPSGGVMSFYNGSYCGRSYTREHIWPFSRLFLNNVTGNERGDNDIEKDLYEIRPCSSSINEGRDNKFYGYDNGTTLYDPGQYGTLNYRGDAARIIFYCVVADDNLKLSENENDGVMQRSMGKLSTLLEWNLEYAVTSRELTRNNAVQDIQGHRNPFVDHPEYACRIWGNTNTKTKEICSSYGFEKDLYIKFDTKSLSGDYSVSYNSHRKLGAYLDSTLATENITWSFVDSSGSETTSTVASLSANGGEVILNANSKGTAKLKCAATYTLSNGETETLSKYLGINIVDETNLSEIDVTGVTQTTYNVGSRLNKNGMVVTASFSDGTKQDVTNYATFKNDIFRSVNPRHRVLIEFIEGSVTKSYSLYINVVDPNASSGGSNGCGGNIATTSITLAAISVVGIAILAFASFRRKKEE